MSSRVKIKKVEDLEPTPLVPPAQDAETAAEEQTPPPAAPVPDKVTRSEGLRIIMKYIHLYSPAFAKPSTVKCAFSLTNTFRISNPENTVVIRHLIVTTVLMFTLPFAAFYGFKYLDCAYLWPDQIFHVISPASNCKANIGALTVKMLDFLRCTSTSETGTWWVPLAHWS